MQAVESFTPAMMAAGENDAMYDAMLLVVEWEIVPDARNRE
jgi:hypothetical protein